jgi:hypothetical protein
MNSKKEKWKQSKTKTKIIQRKIIIKLKSKKKINPINPFQNLRKL